MARNWPSLLFLDQEVDNRVHLLVAHVVGALDVGQAVLLQITGAPARRQEAVVEDPHLTLVLGVDQGAPARDVLAGQIVTIADRVAVKELRHQLEFLLTSRIDPDFHQRPAGHLVVTERRVAGVKIAGELPRLDLVDRNRLQEPRIPERCVTIGVGLVGVVVAVAAGQPLGDHRGEPRDLADGLMTAAALELLEEALLHRNPESDRAQL